MMLGAVRALKGATLTGTRFSGTFTSEARSHSPDLPRVTSLLLHGQ